MVKYHSNSYLTIRQSFLISNIIQLYTEGQDASESCAALKQATDELTQLAILKSDNDPTLKSNLYGKSVLLIDLMKVQQI